MPSCAAIYETSRRLHRKSDQLRDSKKFDPPENNFLSFEKQDRGTLSNRKYFENRHRSARVDLHYRHQNGDFQYPRNEVIKQRADSSSTQFDNPEIHQEIIGIFGP